MIRMAPPGSRRKTVVATLDRPEARLHCCPHFHQAVELVGKRWTGAILYVLLHASGPLRFSSSFMRSDSRRSERSGTAWAISLKRIGRPDSSSTYRIAPVQRLPTSSTA